MIGPVDITPVGINSAPHPEEPAAGRRLEGGAASPVGRPSSSSYSVCSPPFETAAARPPQGEECVWRTPVERWCAPIAALILALVAAGPAAAQQSAPPVTKAGQTRAGEPCEFRPGSGEAALRARLSVNIHCGKGSDPVARVFQIDGAGDPATLSNLAGGGSWRALVDGQANCEGTTRMTLAGQPAVVLACTRRSGGVPYVGVVTTRGGSVFLGDGLSTATPAIEATIAVLSGGQPAAGGRGAIADTLGGRFAAGFGSGDIERYQSLTRIGARHNLEEQYGEAERAYREALALHQRLFGPNNPDQADPLANLAMNISNQGRFEEATELFRRAERLDASVKDPVAKARLRQYIAQHLANQGKRKEAYAALDQAEALYVASAPALKTFLDQPPAEQQQRPVMSTPSFNVRSQRFIEPRRGGGGTEETRSITASPVVQLAAQGVAEIYRTRGLLAIGENQPALGLAHANKAIALLQAVGVDPGGVRWRSIRVAGLAIAGKNPNQASTDLRGSARGLNEALPQSQPAGKTFLESGLMHMRSGNTSQALVEFRRGAQILRARRITVAPSMVFPYLDALAPRTGVVSGGIAVEMFDAAQLMSSGVTAAFVAQAALRLGDGNKNVRELQDLEQRLTELYQRRDLVSNSGADQSLLAPIDSQIGEASQRRDAVEQEVRRTLPNYFQLLQGQPKAADIAGVLKAGEAFAQIVLGDKSGYGLLVRDGQVVAWRIDLTAPQAADIVKKLRAAFLPDARGNLPAYDVALAHDLYKRLLGPVVPRLAGLRELIVTTNGALQSLPFALLVSEPPPPVAEPGDYKKVAWLVKSTTLSYVPAPQSLMLLRRVAARSRAPSAYLGYGGYAPMGQGAAAQAIQLARGGTATTTGGAGGAACVADARELASLPRLALAESEVALTAEKLGAGRAGARTGGAFSRSSVLRGNLERYRIIHFATHALLPTELRCLQQPVILTGAGTGQEALLTAADIAALRLDADLVVLSACNTAGPDGRSAGEALSGLARSFFTAGTRGVLVSHWNVADESTTLMMINLIGDTGKGTSAAAALRKVQMALLAGAGADGDPIRWAHPFYWAPFTFAGGGSS